MMAAELCCHCHLVRMRSEEIEGMVHCTSSASASTRRDGVSGELSASLIPYRPKLNISRQTLRS